MKYYIAFILIVFCSCKNYSGKIISVHDGDSVTMLSKGKVYKIRLYEIDAAELQQTYGIEAKEYLSNLVLNKTVEAKEIAIDKYHRHVCKLFLNGLYINEQMVVSGNAWAFIPYCSKKLLNEQIETKEKHLGLWAYPAISPYNFRHHIY